MNALLCQISTSSSQAPCGPRRSVIARIHQNESGAISVLSVFAAFFFTVLLVQIINVGRQADDKLRMQNSADAVAQSGATVIARGMNAVAFSNHLLCEVFALDAYMREGRDRHADAYLAEIAAAWRTAASKFEGGGFDKFQKLGTALSEKIAKEEELSRAFSDLAAAQSEVLLPVFEYILQGDDGNGKTVGGIIPQFQRAVVRTIPVMASGSAMDLTSRAGQTGQRMHRNEPLRGLIWTTSGTVTGTQDESDPNLRTMPIVDPSPDGPDTAFSNRSCLEGVAVQKRYELSHHYLNWWIGYWQVYYMEWPDQTEFLYDELPPSFNLPAGSETAKGLNYINLFRNFACAQLDQLLGEYSDSNLPHMLREVIEFDPTSGQYTSVCASGSMSDQQILERDYRFVSAVYWPHLQTMFPGLYQNPLHRESKVYALAYAESEVYIPRARYRYPNNPCQPWREFRRGIRLDGSGSWNSFEDCIDSYDNWNRDWSLFNENWTSRLVPANARNLPWILSQHPGQYLNGALGSYRAPQLNALSPEDLAVISPH